MIFCNIFTLFYYKTGTAGQEVIDGIEGTEDADVLTEVARYDLNGRKISSPQKGINIIRQSDIKNYFQALKIYNQALKINNQAMKIYFQGMKIIL